MHPQWELSGAAGARVVMRVLRCPGMVPERSGSIPERGRVDRCAARASRSRMSSCRSLSGHKHVDIKVGVSKPKVEFPTALDLSGSVHNRKARAKRGERAGACKRITFFCDFVLDEPFSGAHFPIITCVYSCDLSRFSVRPLSRSTFRTGVWGAWGAIRSRGASSLSSRRHSIAPISNETTRAAIPR